MTGFSLFDVLTLRPFYMDEVACRLWDYDPRAFRVPLELRPALDIRDETGAPIDQAEAVKGFRRGVVRRAVRQVGGSEAMLNLTSLLTIMNGRPMIVTFASPTSSTLTEGRILPVETVPPEIRLPVFDAMARFERDFLRASDGWVRLVEEMRGRIGRDPLFEEAGPESEEAEAEAED